MSLICNRVPFSIKIQESLTFDTNAIIAISYFLSSKHSANPVFPPLKVLPSFA